MCDTVTNNITEINRCNQRGGRMLSIIDLIERGTLKLRTAAYLATRIQQGTSFVTGAVPGGAGKTTVMGALLNLLPPGMVIVPTEDMHVIDRVRSMAEPVCAVAHEISRGAYYCYIWGDVLRAYFALGREGHTLATNLHADDLDQARAQICGDNGVPEEDLAGVAFVFLSSSGGSASRRIVASAIMVSDGSGGHVPFTPDMADGQAEVERWESTFRELMDRDLRTIEEVREFILLS
jgi:hypothetical protein